MVLNKRFAGAVLIAGLTAGLVLYLVYLRLELALRHQVQQAAARAIPVSGQPVDEPSVACRLGEKIRYEIKLGKLSVGESTFENRGRIPLQGRDAVRVVFQTRLPRFTDTETIYAHAQSFLPLRVERDVAMWPKRERIVEEYDQQAFRLSITKAGARTTVIEKSRSLHNAILLPYQVRCFGSLEPGWKMQVTLPTQEFEIELKRIEDVRVPAGVFRCYYFESTPERFAIWVSADERRLPVKIKGSGGIGYTMMMKSFE